MADGPDIAAGRLDTDLYDAHFGDVADPLDRGGALIDAARCYFCHDAPCIEACPTGIDIPGFIRRIATDNVRGAAHEILRENIMGGACARVCPTEILCEQACVRTTQEDKPVRIGLLQRYATDRAMDDPDFQPFSRAPDTAKRVAVVGAGPAGLACAHQLAQRGHAVTVFEALAKPGGLNEYGIAAYKVADDFAQREVAFILSIGNIDIEYGRRLGDTLSLAELRRDFDATFLGLGLGDTRRLDLPGEDLGGVEDAVDYIARLRQSADLSALPVGRRIVVIGGGNTAIDIAIQTKRLGAEDVSIVYRRGSEQMSATGHEQEFAQVNGVSIRHWAQPVALHGADGHIRGVEFEYTEPDASGRAAGTGETYRLEADMVFKAIGQTFLQAELAGEDGALDMAGGRIVVDGDRRTSLDDVWAGGDCIAGSDDLTVAAVQDGKIAAAAIDRSLQSGS
jgi:glutamate synthase (NADPH/NADH) small chain